MASVPGDATITRRWGEGEITGLEKSLGTRLTIKVGLLFTPSGNHALIMSQRYFNTDDNSNMTMKHTDTHYKQ